MNQAEFPTGKLLRMLDEAAQRSSQLHDQFLQSRRSGMQTLQAMIALQTTGSSPLAQPVTPALFDSLQLDAFGTGQITRCLGPAFARYEGQRIPRIPNGDLRMMSRITAISGTPRDFSQPANVTAEYDVPRDAWYLQDHDAAEIPVSLYMEIALQPCGFLSAYLDSYAFVPYPEFYFRNLDGSMHAVEKVDVRGKTIITTVRLLTSVTSGGTVIQKYAFSLVCGGHTLWEGESTFGYFSPESMSNQLGLDGGRLVQPLLRADVGSAQTAVWMDLARLRQASPSQPAYRLASGRMDFIQNAAVIRDGGRYGKGYIYASRPVNSQDWFYPFHFYQDPVMPGSLGVEAMLEAIQVYALSMGVGRNLRAPRFGLLPGAAPMTWRYRGQITQQHQQTELEVHLSSIERTPVGIALRGDTSLWVDGLRIYEVKNAAVGILEA